MNDSNSYIREQIYIWDLRFGDLPVVCLVICYRSLSFIYLSVSDAKFRIISRNREISFSRYDKHSHLWYAFVVLGNPKKIHLYLAMNLSATSADCLARIDAATFAERCIIF